MAVVSRSTLKDMFAGGTAATQSKFEDLLDSIMMPAEDSVFAGVRFARLSAEDKNHGDPDALFGDFEWAQIHTAPSDPAADFSGVVPEWSIGFDLSDGFIEVVDGPTGATFQINQPGYYSLDCRILYEDLGLPAWGEITLYLYGTDEGPTGNFVELAVLDRTQTQINEDGNLSLEAGRLSGSDVVEVTDVPYYFYVLVGVTGASTIGTSSTRLTVTKLSDLS